MTSIFCKPFTMGTVPYVLTGATLLLAAHALGADTSPSGASAEGTNTGLEEIIVTAERRQESLDKVPISVTAFSQKTMDDLHIENFQDLASVVPGLVLQIPVGGLQDINDVAIRGVFSGGNAPTTQFYIDETPVAIRTLPRRRSLGQPASADFRSGSCRGAAGTSGHVVRLERHGRCDPLYHAATRFERRERLHESGCLLYGSGCAELRNGRCLRRPDRNRSGGIQGQRVVPIGRRIYRQGRPLHGCDSRPQCETRPPRMSFARHSPSLPPKA
jgi:hypothetical protein